MRPTRTQISEQRRLLGNPYAFMEYLEDSQEPIPNSVGHSDNQIQASRKQYKNQYAHLNDKGGYSAAPNHNPPVDPLASTENQIRASRKLYGNPYAHLDGDDRYSAEAYPSLTVGIAKTYQPDPNVIATIISKVSTRNSNQRHHTDAKIEAAVRKIHSEIWKHRELLCGGNVPNDPIDLLEARLALQVIGYNLVNESSLGEHEVDGGYAEVAGMINRDTKTVHISQRFTPVMQSFTAAHELGHAVLHSFGAAVHRDRPFDGESISRNPVEREADRFATFFTMPAKLVTTRFESIFGTKKFQLNEATAFALGKTLSELQGKCKTRRDLSRLLARVEAYNQNYFYSLASQFKVSIEAMAIRLEELGLVDL